jgi:hypothetical protein
MLATKFDAIEFYKRAKEGVDYFEDREGLRHDIKERDPKFKKMLKAAEEEAHRELETKFNFRSDIKAFIRALRKGTKRILKEKHGIDWKTPDEMNPYA